MGPRLVSGIRRVRLGGKMTAASCWKGGKDNLERMKKSNSHGSKYVLDL